MIDFNLVYYMPISEVIFCERLIPLDAPPYVFAW